MQSRAARPHDLGCGRAGCAGLVCVGACGIAGGVGGGSQRLPVVGGVLAGGVGGAVASLHSPSAENPGAQGHHRNPTDKTMSPPSS